MKDYMNNMDWTTSPRNGSPITMEKAYDTVNQMVYCYSKDSQFFLSSKLNTPTHQTPSGKLSTCMFQYSVLLSGLPLGESQPVKLLNGMILQRDFLFGPSLENPSRM